MRIGRRPLTPLEAGIYASLVAIFVTVFATRMLSYMEAAERAMMEVTVTRLMSAASVRRAYGVLRGEADEAAAWTKRNPFELVGFPPPNFSGEIDPLQPRPLERGSWAFDPVRGELIYLPRLHSGLETSDPDGALRFRVEISGARYMLVPTPPYRWQ
jgi:hypothetical protein